MDQLESRHKGAVVGTLNRLLENYGIEATPDDYRVLLTRVRRAMAEFGRSGLAHRMPNRSILDVEFPGEMVRVIYDRTTDVIVSALPRSIVFDKIEAEITSTGCVERRNDSGRQIQTQPWKDAEGTSNPTLTLIGVLHGPIPHGKKRILSQIKTIEQNLSWLRQIQAQTQKSMNEAGEDAEQWRTKSHRACGAGTLLDLAERKLEQLRSALDTESVEMELRSAEGQRIRQIADQIKRKLAEARKQDKRCIRFLRGPGDSEKNIYHMARGDELLALIRKDEQGWVYRLYGEDNKPGKPTGFYKTRALAAQKLLAALGR